MAVYICLRFKSFDIGIWKSYAEQPLEYYALPDLPSILGWIDWDRRRKKKEVPRQRVIDARKGKDKAMTWLGIRRIPEKYYSWVYTAHCMWEKSHCKEHFYPTVLTLARFFICSENIGGYTKLWLKSSHEYSVSQVDTYPTVTNAVTIITSFSYGWTSDAL